MSDDPEIKRLIGALCAEKLLEPEKARRPSQQYARWQTALRGKRVLVVEDEAILGLELMSELLHVGVAPTGPATTLGHAMAYARHQPFDAAILDINLNGTHVFPLADLLNERHIPFILFTGFTIADVLKGFYPMNPVCTKPMQPSALIATLADLISGPA